MKKYAVYLLTVGLFLGCATTNFTDKKDLDNYGIIVGRFPKLSHSLLFEPLLPDTTLSMGAIANPIIIKPETRDTAVACKLKEGTYYIQGIFGSNASLLGSTKYKIFVPLELRQPIVIKKGTVLYIGSFTYDMGGLFQKSSAQFSTSMTGVVDELAKQYPDLKNAPITSLFE